MELSRYSEEELTKIAKFRISQLIMSVTIIHRDNFDQLFQYTSPMRQVNKAILEAAVDQAKKLDIYYGEMKFFVQGEFTAIISEGNYCRAIIILFVGRLDPFIQKYLPAVFKEFIDEYENKYFKVLKPWKDKPDYKAIQGADELLDKVTSMKLNLPHQAKYQGYTPDSLTERTVFDAADQITRKLGYFYLGSLIFLTKQFVINKELEKQRYDDFGKAGKKKEEKKKKQDRAEVAVVALDNPTNIQFPPDEEFYIAMFNLKHRGLLQPININELDSFSKIPYKRAPPKAPPKPAQKPAPGAPPQPAAKAPSGAVLCPECQAKNPPGSGFCQECGEKFSAPQTTTQPEATAKSGEGLPQRKAIICRKCMNDNPPGSTKCSECGAPLEAEAIAATAETGMACPNCGSKNAPGSVFCDECGVKLL